jgi:TRAP-type C4-dicarboxylate transport system permease small subunit
MNKKDLTDKLVLIGLLMLVISFMMMMASYMIILSLWYPTARVEGWNQIEGIMEYQAVETVGWTGFVLMFGSIPTVVIAGIISRVKPH